MYCAVLRRLNDRYGYGSGCMSLSRMDGAIESIDDSCFGAHQGDKGAQSRNNPNFKPNEIGFPWGAVRPSIHLAQCHHLTVLSYLWL